MKYKLSFVLSFVVLISFTSCIRDEALSVQCDITRVSSRWLSSLPSGFILGTPKIKQSVPASVSFLISKGEKELTALNPCFEVSQGATLYYKDGAKFVPYDTITMHDFTHPQTYMVRSEDGNYNKEYVVSFEEPLPLDSCNFSDFYVENGFMHLMQPQEDGSLNKEIWATGNAGFKLTGMGGKYPEKYPTYFATDPVTKQNYACLVTRDTGIFGKLNKTPIAPGSLFIGTFELANAANKPLHATKFGLQIAHGEPVRLSGTYKYRAGVRMIDQDKKVIEGAKDEADIYALLYEVDPNHFVPLMGDDVLTSDRIVMMARLEHIEESKEPVSFSIPFKLMPGKRFDAQRLAMKGYAYTIVMTSSREGANFRGAVGSTLWVYTIKTKWK